MLALAAWPSAPIGIGRSAASDDAKRLGDYDAGARAFVPSRASRRAPTPQKNPAARDHCGRAQVPPSMPTPTKVMEPDSLAFEADRLCAPRCTEPMFARLIHKLAATDRRRNIRTSTATAYTPVPIVGRMDHCIWLGCDWSLDRCRIWVEEIIAACATSTASPPAKPRSSRCSASSTSATCTMPGVFLNYRLR